uniref:Peregrin-like n=1 Tax=Hirondellea gigas TaxID=1518452 RepID=A0A2P2I9J7_9CRUS
MAGHEQFLEFCRSMKPPYQCPIAVCGRVYKSLSGINGHMTTFDHAMLPTTPVTPATSGQTPGTGRKKGQKRPASPILGQMMTGGEPEPPPVPFSTDMKNVEFELDGKPMKISVYDPIEVLSKEEFEASLPPPVEDVPVPEAAKTPHSNKSLAKTPSHKTPKGRPPNSTAADRGIDVQRYTIEDKKSKGLPEASFTIIQDYYDKLPDAPPLTDTYYKFVEKSSQELAEEVEYDLDEEDCAWLELLNTQRATEELTPVKLHDLQLLMDRLEKESFFQAESSGRGDSGVVPIDEDAVCCICMDGECQNSNVILFCDMCNLAVHQECYGVPYIPEGQWLCRRCLQSPSRAVDCALCPNKGGAFKQTDDSRWAHVVCAMWIPEVCFANTVFLEPIDSIGNIPAARWKLTCYICKQRGVGSCIQCNKANCYTAFHVTCAQQASLHMKIDAIRETSISGTSVTVRKAAYCDMHTPHDAEQGGECEAGGAAKRAAEAKAAWRQKMKEARKILAEKRSAAPMVAVPTIPPDRVQELARLVDDVPRVSQFMYKLLAFWTLKRQSRNGVPLLRRLTNAHSSRRNNSGGGGANNSVGAGGATGAANNSCSPRKGMASPEKLTSPLQMQLEKSSKRKDPTMEALICQVKYWQTLRQDLERARLLCELISKREREKKKMINACCELRMVQLSPLVSLQLRVIEQLQQRDLHMIFADPVDLDQVHDYSDVVTEPMDLSTMLEKARGHRYKTIDDLERDFELMISNCLAYNAKDTIFYKAGLKLRDQGGNILSQARRSVTMSGFDINTGLLLPARPKPVARLSDTAVQKLVDDYLSTLSATKLGEETELRQLIDLTYQITYHVVRNSKLKLLRRELERLRRASSNGKAVPATYDTGGTEEEEEEGWDNGKDKKASHDTGRDSRDIADGTEESGSSAKPSASDDKSPGDDNNKLEHNDEPNIKTETSTTKSQSSHSKPKATQANKTASLTDTSNTASVTTSSTTSSNKTSATSTDTSNSAAETTTAASSNKISTATTTTTTAAVVSDNFVTIASNNSSISSITSSSSKHAASLDKSASAKNAAAPVVRTRLRSASPTASKPEAAAVTEETTVETTSMNLTDATDATTAATTTAAAAPTTTSAAAAVTATPSASTNAFSCCS